MLETGVYLISAKFGPSKVLRISRTMADAFQGETIVQGRIRTPENQEFPIVLNVQDRTLDGLKPWLDSLSEQ